MNIEILAPAGNMECVLAGVRNGADAVYLGLDRFSARKQAQNFNIDELKKAVDYCHISGVKVYLTVNTIIFDDEMKDAIEMIVSAYNIGIDALIIQDLGLVRATRKVCPNLRLHGSTQMTVHSVSGAKALMEMGFKRVVLAREMTRAEIKEIAQNVDIELEVFVHGALCMSVSGQCYMSSMIGTRSGNRGACAQPCRLPYKVNGKEGYPISLKDNSIIDYLDDLAQIGVTSAKIEGRMKRPEYVATAVKSCYEKKTQGYVTEQTKEKLEKIFSRTGFTDGYYMDKMGQNMFGTRRKENVVSATEKLFKEIRLTYHSEMKRIGLNMSFSQKGDFPLLAVSDGENTITVSGKVPFEIAQKVAISEEKVKNQLSKLGDTPYYIQTIAVALPLNMTIAVSEINNLRREAIELLSKKRTDSNREFCKPNLREYDEVKTHNVESSPKKRTAYKGDAFYNKEAVTKAIGEKDNEIVFIPLFSALPNSFDEHIGVEIPRVMFGKEEKIIEKLKDLKEKGLRHILCHNIGAVYFSLQLKLAVHGGFGLNLCNTEGMLWAEEMGLQDVTLSIEMTFSQIKRLGGNIKRGIISFGDIPLMITRNCPNKAMSNDCKSCKKDVVLQDRKDFDFRLVCQNGYGELLNSRRLKVLFENIEHINIDFHTFNIYVDNYVENSQNYKDFSRNNQEFTNGLYKRGVKG